jgi:hypothetical protein
MATIDEPNMDAPIPGMGMTHELGGRPWQMPPQHTTIEDALDFYIPRLASEESRRQLFDTLEMGVPVTSIANSIQLSSVIGGKHTVDVGMLVLPVLMEFIMLMADEIGIEYETGLNKSKALRPSSIDLAMSKLEDAGIEGLDLEKEEVKVNVEPTEEETKGLMARRKV